MGRDVDEKCLQYQVYLNNSHVNAHVVQINWYDVRVGEWAPREGRY